MALQLKFERTDKYLLIRAVGTAKSAEDFEIYAATAADFCDSEDCARLLVDETRAKFMVGEISAQKTVNWLSDKDLASRWSRIAAIINPDFWETAEMYAAHANSQGINYRIFETADEAIAWLEED